MLDKEQTILVVEDDETSRLITGKTLINSGYSVITAENGKEAISAFQEHQPDLIIMDIYMPVLDGLKATERIKEIAGDNFIPVVFLTASNEERVLARCLAAGGNDFISKPVSPLVLKAKIDSLLRLRQQERMSNAKLTYQRQRLEQVEMELEVAERILYKIAASYPDIPDNIRYYCSPKQLTSGDILLAYDMPDGRQYLMLGDFTGHGLSAALGTLLVSDIFYTKAKKGDSLESIIRTINRRLKETTPSDYFLAAKVMELNHNDYTVSCWNGAMPPCLIYRPSTGIEKRITSEHLPLGILTEEGFDSTLSPNTLQHDSRMYLYSDGLIETCNAHGEMFSGDRLEATLSAATDPATAFDAVISCLNDFRAGNMHRDDTTLVEVRFREKQKA